MSNTVNILFAATINQLPYAVVTAFSAVEKLNSNYKIRFNFFYATIPTINVEEQEKYNILESAKYFLNKKNIEFNFVDVTEKMEIFEGQNLGMWGERSISHYMYLLAPLLLPNTDKIIYFDTDMLINCDLSEIMKLNFGQYLLAMGAPRGYEEMGEDVSNSGFVVLNLSLWREENTLDKLLSFGKNLPRSRFCDQRLLHEYFKINNQDRMLLLDKSYNIFPTLFPEISLENIKVFHYTGLKDRKPYSIRSMEQRGAFIWWQYAKETPFYEELLYQNISSGFNRDIATIKAALNYKTFRNKYWRYKLFVFITFGKVRQRYIEKCNFYRRKVHDIQKYIGC